MLFVRKVVPEDRAMLDAAAQADPFHRGIGLTGSHWDDGLFYEDECGPVVALQTTNVARVDIQFLTQDRKRNATALMEGFVAYVKVLQGRGVKEIILNTNSAAAIRFIEKRFHFRHLGGNQYSLRIQQ
jgi:hypothetical protein